ncbi:MAG: 4-hydroxythreonine-4-phosphate dehydrogenase PdxA [Armatimonadetes bacterium]|nr:4-hydroxythreonine-4-phosphate dehydrogenase PdxA [Armatimonadota bacterium]
MTKPRIGITLGDPAGIGPEVALKALEDPTVRADCLPILVGGQGSVERARALVGSRLEIRPVRAPEDAPDDPSIAPLLEIRRDSGEELPYGRVSEEGGKAAVAAIEAATALALEGRLDGIATAPVNKEALQRAGCPFPGHTELLAHLTGAKESRMLLVAEGLRVAHNSTHVSLRRACDLAKKDRILRSIQLFHEGLKALGIGNPKIGVCGLNPHAGEGGLFGEEDAAEIAPAVEAARREKIDAHGPYPGDTLFARARAGEFDGALAMYHDQGHVAVKTLGFQQDPETGRWTSVRGVNISLGLPIIRTSVDHGTAFEIAGKGIARAESMADAILMAAQMARHRRSPTTDDEDHR